MSMADVQACLCGGRLADLSTEHQQLVVDTVRSLLKDELVQVGDIPGRPDGSSVALSAKRRAPRGGTPQPTVDS